MKQVIAVFLLLTFLMIPQAQSSSYFKDEAFRYQVTEIIGDWDFGRKTPILVVDPGDRYNVIKVKQCDRRKYYKKRKRKCVAPKNIKDNVVLYEYNPPFNMYCDYIEGRKPGSYGVFCIQADQKNPGSLIKVVDPLNIFTNKELADIGLTRGEKWTAKQAK